MQYVHFKTESGRGHEIHLANQFDNRLDPRMRALWWETSRWFWFRHKKQLVVTCVNRTEKENKEVKGYKYSAHLYGRALDIRIRDLSKTELQEVLAYIEIHWQRPEQWLFIKVHGEGNNRHLHINILFKYSHGSYA